MLGFSGFRAAVRLSRCRLTGLGALKRSLRIELLHLAALWTLASKAPVKVASCLHLDSEPSHFFVDDCFLGVRATSFGFKVKPTRFGFCLG